MVIVIERFINKINSDAWGNCDEVMRTKLLLEATRRIYTIQGFKYTPEVIELLASVPDDLQQACCEVALNLAENPNGENVHIQNQKLGITSISFGNDSASYKDNFDVNGLDNPIFSDYAKAILNKYVIKGYKYV